MFTILKKLKIIFFIINIIIPSLFKCGLLLQLLENCGNYLKIAAILLCSYYILIKNC